MTQLGDLQQALSVHRWNNTMKKNTEHAYTRDLSVEARISAQPSNSNQAGGLGEGGGRRGGVGLDKIHCKIAI